MSDSANLPAAVDDHWLTDRRLRIYPRLIAAIMFVAAIGWVLIFLGVINPYDKHSLGFDFVALWAASHLALAGEPAAAYEAARIVEATRLAIPALSGIYLWSYPPTFLIAVFPLALLPHVPAYLLWIALTLALYVATARRLVPSPHTVWIALAFPATYINVFHGQTGLLAAALFGGAMLCLDRRPVLAGILIGLLSYKPQLGLLIPLVLLFGRHWVTFGVAAAVTLGLAAASVILFGIESWAGFLSNSQLVGTYLQDGFPWGKMPALYATLRIIGVGAVPAILLQAVLALAVAAMVAWVWWRRPSLALRAATLAMGALLVTPYVYDYDLTILGVAVAFLVVEARRSGWRPGEREILLVAWLGPAFMSAAAQYTYLQLGFFCSLAVFVIAFRRARDAISAQARTSSGTLNA